MLLPFVNLINHIIDLVNLGLIVWIVLDMLMRFDIVNRYNPLVRRVHAALGDVFEPMLRPIRRLMAKILPNLGGLDLSPLVLILLLHFVADAVNSWL